MDLIKEEKILAPLKTVRNTWHSAMLYKTSEEARAAGYGLMYDDREGSVWGISRGNNTWNVAFVPKSEYYEKYDSMATLRSSINEKKVYELVDEAVRFVFFQCQQEANIKSGDIDPFTALELDEQQLALTKSVIKVLTHQLRNKENDITKESATLNTKINYLYRDADNYKVHNECVIKGVLTKEQKEAILACLDEGEYFVPHLVGMPEVKFERETEADHMWFELTEDGFEKTSEQPTVSLTADELVESFQQCKGNWEASLFVRRGRSR